MKNVIDTLKNLISEHGYDLLQQEQRLKAMLSDLLPDEKRMRYLMELSIRAEIPKKLQAIQSEEQTVWETHISSMKHYFKAEYFLEDSAVKSVFDCWIAIFPFIVVTKPTVSKQFDKIQFDKILSEAHQKIFGNKNEKTVTDIDGNVYNIVKIGNQEWLVENLKTTHYRNGHLIFSTDPATEEINFWEDKPKYQWAYGGNESNVAKYGRLYTWYAVTDPRGIAPLGWRVATEDDWNKLLAYLVANEFNYDGTTSGNKVAQSLAAKTDWKRSLNIGTAGFELKNNNRSGFSALPGGYRKNGFRSINLSPPKTEFCGFGFSANFWCFCDKSSQFAPSIEIGNSDVYLKFNHDELKDGLSVRCMRYC